MLVCRRHCPIELIPVHKQFSKMYYPHLSLVHYEHISPKVHFGSSCMSQYEYIRVCFCFLCHLKRFGKLRTMSGIMATRAFTERAKRGLCCARPTTIRTSVLPNAACRRPGFGGCAHYSYADHSYSFRTAGGKGEKFTILLACSCSSFCTFCIASFLFPAVNICSWCVKC